MKHVWSILCQKSSIDSETNLLSLFDCLEELSLTIDRTKAPKEGNLIIPIEFQLVSFWLLNKEKIDFLELKIEILNPDKKIIKTDDIRLSVDKPVSRFRSRINFQNLPITKEGRYIFRILQKESPKKHIVVSELPLDIKITYGSLNVVKE